VLIQQQSLHISVGTGELSLADYLGDPSTASLILDIGAAAASGTSVGADTATIIAGVITAASGANVGADTTTIILELGDISAGTGETDLADYLGNPSTASLIDDIGAAAATGISIGADTAAILVDTSEIMRPFKVETSAQQLDTDATASKTATLTCTTANQCIIYEATVHTTVVTATTNIVYIANVSIDGLSLVGADLAAPTDQNFILIGTATAKGKPADIAVDTTVANNVPASVFMTVGAVQGGTAGAASVGPFTLNGGETMTVKVTEATAGTTTVIVTFYGAMTGETAPGTPGFT